MRVTSTRPASSGAPRDKLYEALHLSFRRAARSYIPAAIETLAGDYDAAERELRWGYETLEQMGEREPRATIAAFLAEAVYKQGRDDEAERLTEVSEELAAADDLVPQVLWRSVRAKILARRGELEQAEELGREVVELAANTDFPDLKASTSLDLAEVLTRPARRMRQWSSSIGRGSSTSGRATLSAAQQSGLRSAHPTRSGGKNG